MKKSKLGLAEASGREAFRARVTALPAKPLTRDVLLSLSGAARYLKLNKRMVRRLSDKGRLAFQTTKGVGMSRHWRLYRVVDLDKVLVEHPVRKQA